MTWMFIIIIVSAIVFIIRITTEYMREACILEAQVQHIESGKKEVEVKLREREEAINQAKAQIEEIEQAIKELQAIADNLLAEINQLKKEMEKRGKYRIEKGSVLY